LLGATLVVALFALACVRARTSTRGRAQGIAPTVILVESLGIFRGLDTRFFLSIIPIERSIDNL
jgi:hypothetical protein